MIRVWQDVRVVLIYVFVVAGLIFAFHGISWLVLHLPAHTPKPTVYGHLKSTVTIPAYHPPLNCGAIPVGPGAGPKPPACGLP